MHSNASLPQFLCDLDKKISIRQNAQQYQFLVQSSKPHFEHFEKCTKKVTQNSFLVSGFKVEIRSEQILIFLKQE